MQFYWWPKPDPRKSSELLKMDRARLGLVVQATTGFNNLAYHSENKKTHDDGMMSADVQILNFRVSTKNVSFIATVMPISRL